MEKVPSGRLLLQFIKLILADLNQIRLLGDTFNSGRVFRTPNNILLPNQISRSNKPKRVFINMLHRILGKEFVLQLTSSLWIFENLLDILTLLSTGHQLLGLDKFSLLDNKNSVCDIALPKKIAVFCDM